MLTAIQSAAVSAMEKTVHSGSNLVVMSTAGSGKTYCVEEFSKRYYGSNRIVATTFNKNAALELQNRCKPKAFSKIETLHALGRAILNAHKRLAWGKITDIHFWYIAQNVGYSPKMEASRDKSIAHFVANNAHILMTKMREELSDDVAMLMEKYDIKTTIFKTDYTGYIVAQAKNAIATLENRFNFSGKIDFTDMLYLPVILGLKYRNFDTVIVDEAQDLSPLKLAMLDVLNVKTRILIGDNNQAINIWNGAIPYLLSDVGYPSVALNETHRNGVNMCAYVRERFNVEHYPAANVKTDDQVLNVESFTDIPDVMSEGLILSRTNAAIIPVWHFLVQMGYSANVVNDNGLEAKLAYTVANYAQAVANSEDSDMLATAEAILAMCNDNVSEALAMIKAMFTVANSQYTLSTVHKQKGATWKNVAMLDNLTGIGETVEEFNIRFVACTRATDLLVTVG